MSAVPRTGILRKLYEEAEEDIKYKSSEFWQAYFCHAFSETGTYSVTFASSPNEIVVRKYNENHGNLSALHWIECQSPTSSLAEVETQALDAAQRCIKADGLMFIYVTTTVGVSFRSWIVQDGDSVLEPLHGTAVTADRSQYIGADTEFAHELTRTINLVKNGRLPGRQHIGLEG